MMRERTMLIGAMFVAVTLLPLRSAWGQVAANDVNDKAPPAVAAAQGVVAAIAALISEYEPTNDRRILGCLRRHHGRAQMLEAAVLGAVAAGQAAAPEAAAQSREALLNDSLGQAAQIEADARACLWIQSGQIVDYAANDAEGPPDELPDLQVPPSPVVTEPEPIDQPLSDAEIP